MRRHVLNHNARWLLLILAIALVPGCASAAPAMRSRAPIFQFYTDELWLNLHHFLHVLGRAEGATPDTRREAVANAPADARRGLETLSADEQKAWREAVDFYAKGLSQKDLVFDKALSATTLALAQAGDRPSLTGLGLDTALVRVVERAAPVYKKVWWPEHRAANIATRDDLQRNIDRYGAAVLASIVKAYGMQWPAAGYPVHLSGYTNWAGAYSTTGNLLVFSSLNSASKGSLGFEIVFHEAMHQWDNEMFVLLREHTRRMNKLVPRDITHAMIWVTAGDAVRRVIPSHVPYAEVAGIWNRGLGPYRSALQKTWQPYLDGQGTRDEALARLMAETAVSRP